MNQQVAPAERLLNLVIALANTPGRMTKEQIRRLVAGYSHAASDEAFERMFERDKDALRELGIPVQTVTGAAHGDDVGYRVDMDAYALPPIDLTAAELGVLALAATFWQDAAMRTNATRGLTKLRAVGEAPPGTDAVAGFAPHVRAPGAAFGPLLDAVAARRAVAFTYRAASTGETRPREVEPWRLLAARGGWYLIGWDRTRGAARSFRLSRIEGRIRPVGPGDAFTVPHDVDLQSVLGFPATGTERRARLALLPERAGALRARAVPDDDDAVVAGPLAAGRDVITVPYRSTTRFADELVGYADAALVLDPPELRRAVVDRLRLAVRLAPGAGAAASVDPPVDPPVGPGGGTDG